jgi:Methyltransferase domain
MAIYQSNLIAPDLSPHFRLREPAIQMMGHDIPSDPDFEPDCGFWSHDEAAILYQVAKSFPPGPWIDIGARFGWTTAHISAAIASMHALHEGDITAVDTHFAEGARRGRMIGSMVSFWCGYCPDDIIDRNSREFFRIERCSDRPYRGFVIDANHDEPEPLLDAHDATTIAGPQCVIMLHDFWGRPVRQAVEYLMREGFQCRIYNTPNGVACCWRDEGWTPPDHVPDPAINWALIREQQAPEFDFSGTV